jgi:large repetitive protein
MVTTKGPVRPRAPTTGAKPGLDARVLGLASLASVLGGIVASAFGGGPQATLICAAISPWITAFLTHPGPHRVRRVTAVLLFAFLVGSCRKAFAAVRTAARLPAARRRDRRGDASGKPAEAGAPAVSPAQVGLTRAWLGQVTLTAATSFALAVASLTIAEAIRGQAVAAERDTTFFSGAPLPSGPTVRVPDGVVARAGDDTAARVTYHVTAADATGNPLVPACDPPSGARFTLGETRVECSATDAAGDHAQADFVVTVRRGGSPQPPDHKQPALTVPDDFSHDATTADGARVTYAASARDARDGGLTPDCEPASGSYFQLGRTRVVCTAADAAGNTAHAGFTITVIRAGDADDKRPVMTVPDAIETRARSQDGANVTYDASASDNRDGALKAVCEPPSGSLFPIGTTTVTCSAQDAADNKATKSFTVTVARTGHPDLTPPDINVPDPISTRATSKDGATVTYKVLATDNRDRELKPRCDPPSGSVFKVGKTTVICSARDSAGNQDTKTFTVTVSLGGAPPPNRGSDRTAPTITVPDPIRISATGKDGAIVTYDVSATDDRNRALNPSCDRPSGSVFPFGKTTVDCSARDSAGNTATKSFTVTVFDGTPPVITVPDTIEEYGFSGGTPVTYQVSATDDRDGTLKPTCKPPSGSDFPPGPTTVNCSAEDSAGNKATKSFTVIVVSGGT